MSTDTDHLIDWNRPPESKDWQGSSREVYQQTAEKCVAYTIVGLLRSDPGGKRDTTASYRFAADIHEAAMEHASRRYDFTPGTKIKDALDVLEEWGLIEGFYRVFSEHHAIYHLSQAGPLVGVHRWWIGNSAPPKGELWFQGREAYGNTYTHHAALWDGIKWHPGEEHRPGGKRRIICTNTSGIDWGEFGRGWIPGTRIPELIDAGALYGVSGRGGQGSVEAFYAKGGPEAFGYRSAPKSIFAKIGALFGRRA